MTKGSGSEMCTYNGKDKPAGKLKYVQEVTESGIIKIAKVKSEFFDKKSKEQFTGDYEVKCDGQHVYADMSAYFNQQLQAYKNVEVTMEAEYFMLPKSLKLGEDLKDAKVVANMNSNGARFGTMTLTSVNKKVVDVLFSTSCCRVVFHLSRRSSDSINL